MPAALARYDVILVVAVPGWTGPGEDQVPATLDFLEQRDPDADGEPGRLRDARLVRGATEDGRTVESCGGRRFRIHGQNSMYHATQADRRYLRWQALANDGVLG